MSGLPHACNCTTVHQRARFWMEVLRHSGCNWSLGSIAANENGTVLAAAVRSSIVLLRTSDGVFLGEIRQLGRGSPRARSLCFAKALGLTHLLAAVFDDGSWRVFDADTRRIVRVSRTPSAGTLKPTGRSNPGRRRQANAVCFGEETPNLLFVGFADGNVDIFDLALCATGDGDNSVGCVNTLLVVESVRVPMCLASVTGSAHVLLVGGQGGDVESRVLPRTDSARFVGAVVAVDVRNGSVLSALSHNTGPVHSISVSLNEKCTFVAYVSGVDGVPVGAVCRDGQLATVGIAGHADEKPATSTASSARKVSSTVVSTVSWMFSNHSHERFAVCSTGAGALQVWQVTKASPSFSLVEKLEGFPTHSRQVFTIAPTAKTNSNASDFQFCTASMDRRICGWRFSDGGLSLDWESHGSGGHVQALDSHRILASEFNLRALLGLDITEVDLKKSTADDILVAAGYGDGYVTIDCVSDEAGNARRHRSILRYQVPSHGRDNHSSPQSVSFHRLSLSPNGGELEAERLCVVISTLDGRLGCIILGIGEVREATPNVDALWSKPIAPRKPPGEGRSGSLPTVYILSVSKDGCIAVLGHDGYVSMCTISMGTKSIVVNSEPSSKGPIVDHGKVSAYASVSCDTGSSSSSLVAIAFESCELGLVEISTRGATTQTEEAVTIDSVRHGGKLDSCFISSLLFAEKSSRLAAGFTDGSLSVYSLVRTDRLRLTSQWNQNCVHSRRVSSLSWAPSEGYIACTSDDGLSLGVDDKTGKVISKMKGHSGRVLSCAAIASDYVITGGEDCSLREWQLSRLPK